MLDVMIQQINIPKNIFYSQLLSNTTFSYKVLLHYNKRNLINVSFK